MYAVGRNHFQAAKSLLQGRANVNAKDIRGMTALMLAAGTGHKESVEILLQQKNIEINVQENRGFTALMGAAYSGHEEIVALLIEKGAKVGLLDKEGKSALAWAKEKQFNGIVHILEKTKKSTS